MYAQEWLSAALDDTRTISVAPRRETKACSTGDVGPNLAGGIQTKRGGWEREC